jgi:hypothetical protein
VVQEARIELVLNLNAAKILGITSPLPLLDRVDELSE